MKLSIDEVIDTWEDVLESAEATEYEVKNLVSDFLDDLRALERN